MTDKTRLALEKFILMDGILSLRKYCLSQKFHGFENQYVNPDDIVLRIEETLQEFNRVY